MDEALGDAPYSPWRPVEAGGKAVKLPTPGVKGQMAVLYSQAAKIALWPPVIDQLEIWQLAGVLGEGIEIEDDSPSPTGPIDLMKLHEMRLKYELGQGPPPPGFGDQAPVAGDGSAFTHPLFGRIDPAQVQPGVNLARQEV